MILGIVTVVAVGVAVYEYFTNAAFKAEVESSITTANAEVANLEAKAKSGVAVVEADFAKVKTAVAAIIAKL